MSEAAVEQPGTGGRFRELPLPLRVLFIASFVNRAGLFVFPLLAVYLTQGKHLHPATAGLLISGGSTGLLVGSLLSAPASRRYGRRFSLVAALLLNVAGYLGLATTDGPPWTYAVFLFVALVGMGMFGPTANALIADLATPEQRPYAYTVNYISNNLGMGIGPLLGGVAAAYSFRLMFAGDISASLLCAALIVVWIPKGSREAGARKAKSGSRGPGDRRVLLVVLTSFFYVAPLIGLEYTLPLGVTSVLHQSVGLVGAVYTVNSVVVVSAGMLVEKRIGGYGTKALLIAAGSLWAAGLALLAFAFSVPALLLSTAVWTVGEIIASVVVPTYIADHAGPDRVGGFMALNGFVLGLVRLVVPASLGALWQADGHHTVFLVLLATPIVGMAAFAALPLRSDPSRALPAPGPAAEPITEVVLQNP